MVKRIKAKIYRETPSQNSGGFGNVYLSKFTARKPGESARARSGGDLRGHLPEQGVPRAPSQAQFGAAGIGEDGEVHPTSAGPLMFGEEWRIMGEFPHYFLDYRQETSPETRWQDRVTSQTDEWSGNVFDFYQRAYEKMKQALKVPFKLDERSLRVDETPAHDALREAIANCLTNADYNERRGVVLLWQEDGLKLSNPGGFRVSIEDACTGGNSDPRNETMMKMFSLVHVGERAGSGIPNMMKNWLDAGYDKPMLSEQVNPERSTIFLPLTQIPTSKKWTEKVDEKSGRKKWTKSRQSRDEPGIYPCARWPGRACKPLAGSRRHGA